MMKSLRYIAAVSVCFLFSNIISMPAGNIALRHERQDDKTRKDSKVASVPPAAVEIEEDTIPDSLLHPRWKVQRTVPLTVSDLHQGAADLARPGNLKQDAIYNDTLGQYVFGAKMGGTYLNAPLMMTPEEYRAWSFRKTMNAYFRSKNAEIYQAKGKEKFDFSDMHFDLGPAEKIFGPGGVRIKTQGSAELKFGATLKNIDNPSLPIRNRKTTTMNFDEKINVSVKGKVGDKVDMNLNYNTDATFDFDAQNLKLKYEGKEDEIIKLVEAGNVSFPSNSSLITGASSLFGIRTDMQFGKLKLQTVLSQKKSSTKSVSSRGGVQLTPFEIDAADYEENRHFFLSQYFRSIYDKAMQSLPNLMTGVKINRVEIWVTNKTGTTANTRNIIALTDLGENTRISNPLWSALGVPVPANSANTEYGAMTTTYADARDIDRTGTVLDAIAGFTGGTDYEKLESARLLNASEYTVNNALGYVSLRSGIQTDQVLAVAYEYTYGGMTYQVGEFASDVSDVNKALFVKSLKNTSNHPKQGNWDLMMKNVYYLASSVERDRFRLDIKYRSDTTGVYLNYLPEQQVKNDPLIKAVGADRLDNNNKPHANGYFDYVEGYTVAGGRVFLPKVEPFGQSLYNYLLQRGVSATKASSYSFTELYDSTKTVAKQMAEKDKFVLAGQFRGTSANIISLGAYNVPQGSVKVTAGGVTLSEGSDYSVDYSAGEVTILNQSILDAGTPVNVSLESNTDYGQQRKTMLGLNWQYDFSKNFQLGGTFQHLSEQSLTSKVSMGSEPLNNTLWGINLNWKKESQWLTHMLDKIPFLHVTAPSYIQLNAEFAQLIAGKNRGTQDNASYLDDFENTKSTIDVSTPTSWVLSSVPSMFAEHTDKTTLRSGFNRARLAWYTIDPLFTRRSSSLTPGHIKSDIAQLSNHYVREVPVSELYPNRDQSAYNGALSTLSILNLAYYPTERGPYNFDPTLNADGTLPHPQQRWGGMMRRLDTNDFEKANIEYIEFWLLDPFIYSNTQSDAAQYGADFYVNLGEISEDVLHDGKKFYESGMPVDGSQAYTTTQWGRIPNQATVTYAFATSAGARELQDVGYNGLTDTEEQQFTPYQPFLTNVQANVAPDVYQQIQADPANDDYHYFRGSDFDRAQTSILERYKRINNPQGNSPSNQPEGYDTSYKTTPDVEDINQDYTLNEYEKYYQYHVSLRPQDMVVGRNFIVDKREALAALRDGSKPTVTWYQFRIPLDRYERREGGISDFTSIRFMRMFLTNSTRPLVLRFGSFDLVRGDWRLYEQPLNGSSAGTGHMAVSAVSIEENGDKDPVNYVLPPGISRVVDPSQPQLTENNEQALNMVVTNLSTGQAKAVYKNTSLDLRQYKRLQMFVHANALQQNTTNLADNQLSVFIRLGSDYKNNYYEYEIPLRLTPAGRYDDTYSGQARAAVWPEENMLDIPLSVFTALKKARNRAKAQGLTSYTTVFSLYDNDRPNNKISIMGNPTLGDVHTMMIGVRNNSGDAKSGEIWVNELRLRDYNNEGGWAAQGNLNMQLSDFGTVNVAGKYMTDGFGGLEQGVNERSKDNYGTYSMTASLELGKFFPDKAKVSAPLYYSVTKEKISPKYNPLDTDMRLKDALDATGSRSERDSIESIAVTKTTNTNFSLSNMRVGIATKHHPMPYDPANFSFSYSHSHRNTSGKTTVYENEDKWRGAINYTWSPVYKTFEPFKALIRNRSKWFDILKRFGLNWLPQNLSFNSEIIRNYYELQERDMMGGGGTQLPLTFNEQFLWNRDFSVRWDLTHHLHASFQSATHAEVEEPYTPVNKSLYPDHYHAWKDSVWTSIKHMGTPLDYNQTFTASYQLPLHLLPVFDWINADANYNATYGWVRGTHLEDGTSLGNIVTSNRTFNLNGTFNMERLYDHIPFLRKTNERFRKRPSSQTRKRPENPLTQQQRHPQEKQPDDEKKKALPRNQRSYEQELTLKPDTSIIVNHGKKTRRFFVAARTTDGKVLKLKYRKLDDNRIRVSNPLDTAITLKLTVTPREPLDNQPWYSTAQHVARMLMMVRTVSISYRNQYALSLPGFLPTVGDAFGQSRGMGLLAPGLNFAFGMVDDNYIGKARDNGWLLMNDSVATPATTNRTEDVQIRLTLEPIRNLKIDLNASRTETRARSIQYMYTGTPTTQSGTFTMTTLSLRSAFESVGDARSGYRSASFERFCNALDGFRTRVESQYAGARYPQGSTLAGNVFNPANGGVNRYSADVMVPAFLSTYTGMGGNGLSIFPSLSRLLPNWTVRYSGLVELPWFRDVFKSINLNHAYKSIYAVGSYGSYSTYMEYMNGLGFVTDATTGNPVPSSMYNVSQVSINEAFSPLLGIDMTFLNNLSCKLEYRTTRVLSLSMTSIQINEATSRDWVVGMGYRINDVNLFGNGGKRRAKGNKKTPTDARTAASSAATNTRGLRMNHDLNLRLDLSYRRQAAISRDIAGRASNASSGNTAFKLSFMADYTLSRLLTLSFYYDRQTNTPLLSGSSYPTTTQDFGLSMKLSLTH